MKQRLFNLAAAASVLFFVAVDLLWVRSYGSAEEFAWRHRNGEIKFAAERGTALLVLDRGPRGASPAEWYGLKHFRDARSFPVSAATARMYSLSIDLRDKYVISSWARYGWYEYRPASGSYSLSGRNMRRP